MGVTINDIAEASGVSKATVSYILNNKPSAFSLSQQTIRRVLDVCAEMHYSPDRVAQALAFQRRTALSIRIFSPWLYAQHSDFMAIFNRTVEKLNASMKLDITFERFTPGALSKSFKVSQCGKYDAVLILGTAQPDERFLVRNREKITNVIAMNRSIQGILSCAGNDRETCAALAESVAKNGHYRRYVVISHDAASRREKSRAEGFAAGLKRGKAEPVTVVTLPADGQTKEECQSLLDRYTENGTAFFFGTHLQAAHMMTEAHKRKLEIPGEIGIVGYDRNSILDDFLFPEMTTIDPRIEAMTQTAIELAKQLKSGKKPKSVTVEANIVSGGSCMI